MEKTQPVLDTRQAMAARLLRCTPADQIIGGPIRELHLAAERSGDEALLSRVLRALPQGSRYDPAFRYPVADLLQGCLAWGDHALEQGRAFDEGVHVDVTSISDGLLQSPLGQTLQMLSQEGPHRLLAQSNAALRATTTFGRHRYRKLGDRRAAIDAEGDLLGPAWLARTGGALLQRMFQVHVHAELASTNAERDHFTLELEWR